LLDEYRQHVEERAKQGIAPEPLNPEQTAALIKLLKEPPVNEQDFILDLIVNRVPAGVDQAAYIKAGFLAAITTGETESPLIDKIKATELLGTMLGGYNIAPLICCLDDNILAETAAKMLSKTLLMFDAFYDVKDKAESNNKFAKIVMQSWADGEWFTTRQKLQEKILKPLQLKYMF